ncbi:MAG: hypothetical protein F4Y02_05240 [Chloroflexi bacterium]|nr:hypothetical protein [Chloroflexota bacterium]
MPTAAPAGAVVRDAYGAHFPDEPEPLKLPLDYAPPKVRRHGLSDAHPFPLVSDGKGTGDDYAHAHRVRPWQAWSFPEIEYARTPTSFAALVVDVDGAAAGEHLVMAVENGEVCEPNWAVMRRASGGIHVVWTLACPVHRYPTAKAGPLKALARVGEFYASALDGDAGYAGVLAHNPMADGHRGRCVTTWLRHQPYSLGELAERIPAGWHQPRLPAVRTAAGRNDALFRALCRFAGTAGRNQVAIAIEAERVNAIFTCPLPAQEVRHVVASVLRYRARWAASGWHQASFLAKQARRGAAGGRVSKGGGRPRKWADDAERKREWKRRNRGATKQANTG